MQITLKVDGIDYVLAHGSAHGVDLHVGPTGDFRNSLRTSLQVDPIVDADHPAISDRVNRVGRWPFSVEVEKTSTDAAMEYALTYPDQLPRRGDIWIETDGLNIKMLNAGIEDVSAALYGVRVFISYQVVYGAMEYA